MYLFIQSIMRYARTHRSSVPHLLSYSVYMSVLVTSEVCYTCFHNLCKWLCWLHVKRTSPVFIPCVHVCVVTGEMCHTCLHTLSAPSGQSGHAAPMGVHLHTVPWPGVHCVTAQHTACADGIVQGLRQQHTVCGVGPWLRPGDESWQVSLQRGHRVDVQHTQRVSQ